MVMPRIGPYSSVYLRSAIGFAFLSAVADRFGWWGAPGETGVVWGSFSRFLAYTATLNPYLPSVNRTGFVGGHILREDVSHVPTQQVFARTS